MYTGDIFLAFLYCNFLLLFSGQAYCYFYLHLHELISVDVLAQLIIGQALHGISCKTGISAFKAPAQHKVSVPGQKQQLQPGVIN